MEKRSRSLAKTISWRIVATATTIFLVFLFTGSLTISASVGIFEILSKSIIYYLHERVWNMLNLGREQS